jgi:hypothetical protein
MTRVCLNVDARLWKTQGNIESDSYAFPRPDSLGDIWPNYTRLIQRHPHNAEAFPSYAREFPTEIAGVALIESSSPRQIDELPGFRASYQEDKRAAQRTLWKDRFFVWSGWSGCWVIAQVGPMPYLVDTRLPDFLGLGG